jgi:hypothetical protein
VAAVEQQVVADVTPHQPTDAELQKYFDDNHGAEGLVWFLSRTIVFS